MKTLLDIAKWANWLTAIAQLLGIVTGLFPAKPWTPTLLAIQAAIQGLMTSIGGIGHRMSYNEAQTPAKRTTSELSSAAVAVAQTMTEERPSGTSVAVPVVTTAYVTVPERGA